MKLGNKGYFQLQQTSRRKKFELFMHVFEPTAAYRILDIGGAEGSFFSALYPWPERVIVVDLRGGALEELRRSTPVLANALRLPFADDAFDIVWSNAVIEHVGVFEMQQKFADEIRRVGQGYFVATPWKGFPIELHYKMPLYQFVPKRVQRWLIQRMDIGWREKGRWEDINLLWQRQLRQLFPDGRVVKQRVTIWPENLIAYRARQGGSAPSHQASAPLD
jgi:hypothetical protein